MNPDRASCQPAPVCRPPFTPLVTPVDPPATSQPALPLLLPTTTIQPVRPVDPKLRQLARMMMSALVEALSGHRPVAQLDRWFEPDLLELVTKLRDSRDTFGVQLRSFRVQAPRPGALEISARLSSGPQSCAVALRVSKSGQQWVGTHLEIALPAVTVTPDDPPGSLRKAPLNLRVG